MNKKYILTIIAVVIVAYLTVNIIGYPVDCMPRIGEYPLLERIFRFIFRDRCYAY